jgi:hypothetical protein
MVTHEHADHLDVSAVRTALQASPELTLWAKLFHPGDSFTVPDEPAGTQP